MKNYVKKSHSVFDRKHLIKVFGLLFFLLSFNFCPGQPPVTSIDPEPFGGEPKKISTASLECISVEAHLTKFDEEVQGVAVECPEIYFYEFIITNDCDDGTTMGGSNHTEVVISFNGTVLATQTFWAPGTIV